MNRFEDFIFMLMGNEIEGNNSTTSECSMRKQKSPLKESPESLKALSAISTNDGNMERRKIEQP